MTNPLPADSYVLFLDLLGFKNVVDAWESNGRQALLIELVRYISTAESTYSAKVTLAGASVNLVVRPAITTFSDCVVVSFPTAPPGEPIAPEFADALAAEWLAVVLKHMAQITAEIASRAIRLMLLPRGGICRGPLVHEEKYIIGPALNRAYAMETEEADTPRLLVADEIYKDAPGLFPSVLRRDNDGRAFLDYMEALTELVSQRSDHSDWRKCRLQEIDDFITTAPTATRCGNDGRKAPASVRDKWVWFRRYFDEGTFSLQVK